ncbi:MAG: ArgE/DapE family deacylase [Candidatus Kariarchaeaceae archaeon]|jgi:acetylornithine deacetylase
MSFQNSKAFIWVRENKELLIKLTQELVRIPSVSGLENDVQQFVFKKFQQIGLESKLVNPNLESLKKHQDYFETTSFEKYGYDDRPNVTGLLKGGGSGQSLCLSGHVDVVSPEPLDQWTKDPWGGEVDGNKLYGRGSGDMKAGVAAMIIAVQALIETGTKLNGDVHLETTIEEEDGGVGGVLYMRTVEPKYDGVIIPEPMNFGIGVASAGVMYFRVKVPGIPAHAAMAHFGTNAILKMQPVITAINKLHEQRQKLIHYKYAEQDDSMKGRATTINIGTVKAGDWPSTVPGDCTIECRIGWPPGETREEVMKQVEDTVKKAAQEDSWLKDHLPTVEWFGWKARPHELAVDHPFVQSLKIEAEKIVGVTLPHFGGSAGLDARYFVHHDIPAVTFGPYAERIHSFDEFVDIESVVKTAEVMVVMLQKHCGVSN